MSLILVICFKLASKPMSFTKTENVNLEVLQPEAQLRPGPGSSQLLRLVLLHHIVHSLVAPEVTFLLVGLLKAFVMKECLLLLLLLIIIIIFLWTLSVVFVEACVPIFNINIYLLIISICAMKLFWALHFHFNSVLPALESEILVFPISN